MSSFIIISLYMFVIFASRHFSFILLTSTNQKKKPRLTVIEYYSFIGRQRFSTNSNPLKISFVGWQWFLTQSTFETRDYRVLFKDKYDKGLNHDSCYIWFIVWLFLLWMGEWIWAIFKQRREAPFPENTIDGIPNFWKIHTLVVASATSLHFTRPPPEHYV